MSAAEQAISGNRHTTWSRTHFLRKSANTWWLSQLVWFHTKPTYCFCCTATVSIQITTGSGTDLTISPFGRTYGHFATRNNASIAITLRRKDTQHIATSIWTKRRDAFSLWSATFNNPWGCPKLQSKIMNSRPTCEDKSTTPQQPPIFETCENAFGFNIHVRRSSHFTTSFSSTGLLFGMHLWCQGAQHTWSKISKSSLQPEIQLRNDRKKRKR